MRFRLADHVTLTVSCLLLGLLYFYLYGRHGFGDTDQGFLQALGWRIQLGQLPYRDFIYVRPPLSPYLHSLLASMDWGMWLERLLFYVMMAFSSLFATLSLQRFFSFRAVGISPLVFMVMAFVLSVHNYPPMPWHTVDGIFFGSLGIWLVARAGGDLLAAYLGLLAMVAAALTKQAFYPMLLVGPALLLLLHPGKSSQWALALYVSTLGLLLVGAWVFAGTWLEAFWRQTTGVTNWDDLWAVGVVKYGKAALFLVLPLLGVWWLQSTYSLRGWVKYAPMVLFWLFFFGMLGLHVFRSLQQQAFVPPSFGFGQAMFLLALGGAVRASWIRDRGSFLLLGMLALAWCSGISWGYATPMLFFSPMLFGFIHGVKEELEFRAPRYFYGLVCFLLFWTYAMLYQFPYREAPRDQITYELASIFPRYAGMYGGKEIYQKSLELKLLHQRHGSAYTVLPAFPLAHCLTETVPVLPVDWAHNAEMVFDQNRSWLLRDLRQKAELVFIQRDRMNEFQDQSRYGSTLGQHVLQHWQPVDSTTYFTVFRAHASPAEPASDAP